jgi:hypothetical protein
MSSKIVRRRVTGVGEVLKIFSPAVFHGSQSNHIAVSGAAWPNAGTPINAVAAKAALPPKRCLRLNIDDPTSRRVIGMLPSLSGLLVEAKDG